MVLQLPTPLSLTPHLLLLFHHAGTSSPRTCCFLSVWDVPHLFPQPWTLFPQGSMQFHLAPSNLRLNDTLQWDLSCLCYLHYNLFSNPCPIPGSYPSVLFFFFLIALSNFQYTISCVYSLHFFFVSCAEMERFQGRKSLCISSTWNNVSHIVGAHQCLWLNKDLFQSRS